MTNNISVLAAIIQETATEARQFSWLWSVVVPGVVLFGSVVATYMLYRHFSKKMKTGS